MKKNIVILNCILLLCFSLSQCTKKKSNVISPFEIYITSFDYAAVTKRITSINNKEIKVIFKVDLDDEKDSLLFKRSLNFSDTLRLLSESDIANIRDYYENPCVMDGLQILVFVKNEFSEKKVKVSNFYQPEIGKIIKQANLLLPQKYKIWYGKEYLDSAYNYCIEYRKEKERNEKLE